MAQLSRSSGRIGLLRYAVEDDVVCRWVEGETVRRNDGQQLMQPAFR